MARSRIVEHPSSLYHGMAYTVEKRIFFIWRHMSTFASFLEAENFICWYEGVLRQKLMSSGSTICEITLEEVKAAFKQ